MIIASPILMCRMRGKDQQKCGVKSGIHEVSSTKETNPIRSRGGRKGAELYGTSNDFLSETKRLE
jgi:hypothetical protein